MQVGRGKLAHGGGVVRKLLERMSSGDGSDTDRQVDGLGTSPGRRSLVSRLCPKPGAAAGEPWCRDAAGCHHFAVWPCSAMQ